MIDRSVKLTKALDATGRQCHISRAQLNGRLYGEKADCIMMNIGTVLFTWLNGELVGTDEFGNRYYRAKTKKRWGREQRWCMFKGERDSTKVPAEWHAWLHHTVDEPLTQMSADPKPWQKTHEPNMTGTAEAYRPQGHAFKGGARAAASGDYEAWTPE